MGSVLKPNPTDKLIFLKGHPPISEYIGYLTTMDIP